MEAKITKRTAIELTKKEVEDIIKGEIRMQTGIEIGGGSIQWGGSAPCVPFAWITIEEPLDE